MVEMEEITISPVNQTASMRTLPFREDCWSEEATSTLVDAWGRRYIELNKGNLRQKDLQEVADAVNALHGHTKKAQRTDVQCKNRIDTLKKKYKVEKAKIAESNGTLTSSWPFFDRLDFLIGNSVKHRFPKVTPAVKVTTLSLLPSPPMAVPMALPLLPYRRSITITTPGLLPQKRPLPSVDDSYFRRNYSAVAAAAAAADEEEDEEESEEEEIEETNTEEDGIRRLAKAIERFGEIYERVEGMKQRQMVELEKQRMQFAKDLEVQRIQLFMDTQVQLRKMKQAKQPAFDDNYS